MPYDCGEMEVHQFFAPLKLIDCEIIFDDRGLLLTSFKYDFWLKKVLLYQQVVHLEKQTLTSRALKMHKRQ